MQILGFLGTLWTLSAKDRGATESPVKCTVNVLSAKSTDECLRTKSQYN